MDNQSSLFKAVDSVVTEYVHNGKMSMSSFKEAISVMGKLQMSLISSVVATITDDKEDFLEGMRNTLLEMQKTHEEWVSELAKYLYE